MVILNIVLSSLLADIAIRGGDAYTSPLSTPLRVTLVPTPEYQLTLRRSPVPRARETSCKDWTHQSPTEGFPPAALAPQVLLVSLVPVV